VTPNIALHRTRKQPRFGGSTRERVNYPATGHREDSQRLGGALRAIETLSRVDEGVRFRSTRGFATEGRGMVTSLEFFGGRIGRMRF
jgi:hypothetical protein